MTPQGTPVPWWAADPKARAFIVSGKCGCPGCKQRRAWLVEQQRTEAA